MTKAQLKMKKKLNLTQNINKILNSMNKNKKIALVWKTKQQ